jgi:transposase
MGIRSKKSLYELCKDNEAYSWDNLNRMIPCKGCDGWAYFA